MNKTLLILLITAGVLAGCGGSSSKEPQTPAQKIAALETSGAIPALERSDTLEGIDANNSGVRDDIETYISNTYPQENQRMAAMQYAEGMQAALLIEPGSIDEAKQVQRRLSKAIDCLFIQFEHDTNSKHPAAVAEELTSMTTNTKARLKAYLAYNKALDGTSWALHRGDSCE